MTKFCPTCGKQLQYENAEICPSCGVRIQSPPTFTEIRSAFLAIILSFFFPGWGQWYNGKTWDGLKFFGIFLVSYFLMLFSAAVLSTSSLTSIIALILFVVLFGCWIYGMYDANRTANRINQRQERFSGKSVLFWLPFIFLILIMFAVFAAFVFGMAGASSSSVQTTEEITYQTIQTIVPLKTIASKSTIIDSNGKSGWVQYTNYNDHFIINKPSDWTVQTLDKSKITKTSDSIYSQTMDDFVYIYGPNAKGFIMIYGVDFSGTIYSIFDDPEKTQISNELYDSFASWLKSGETDDVKIISIQKDNNFYLINGNPARRLTVYSTVGGKPLSGDWYVIAHDIKYYVLGYSGMAGATQSDSSTATDIMRTFIITP